MIRRGFTAGVYVVVIGTCVEGGIKPSFQEYSSQPDHSSYIFTVGGRNIVFPIARVNEDSNSLPGNLWLGKEEDELQPGGNKISAERRSNHCSRLDIPSEDYFKPNIFRKTPSPNIRVGRFKRKSKKV